MRARVYAALVLVPAVLALVGFLFGDMAAAGPCPSASGGGC